MNLVVCRSGLAAELSFVVVLGAAVAVTVVVIANPLLRPVLAEACVWLTMDVVVTAVSEGTVEMGSGGFAVTGLLVEEMRLLMLRVMSTLLYSALAKSTVSVCNVSLGLPDLGKNQHASHISSIAILLHHWKE